MVANLVSTAYILLGKVRARLYYVISAQEELVKGSLEEGNILISKSCIRETLNFSMYADSIIDNYIWHKLARMGEI